jgi:uncharacterized protein YkwD
MDIEDGDWDNEPREQDRQSNRGWVLAVVVVFGLFFAILAAERLQYLGGQRRAGDVKLSILPGLPSLTLHKGSLYPANDPWTDYLASEATCPGGERTDQPLGEQANTMVCLINYARQRYQLSTLIPASMLNTSSLGKADKIARCNDFTHTACGAEADEDARWLNSPEHRENLFMSEWTTDGIAVMKVARLDGYTDVTLWVNQFGTS